MECVLTLGLYLTVNLFGLVGLQFLQLCPSVQPLNPLALLVRPPLEFPLGQLVLVSPVGLLLCGLLCQEASGPLVRLPAPGSLCFGVGALLVFMHTIV